jgi:hypothetical protein
LHAGCSSDSTIVLKNELPARDPGRTYRHVKLICLSILLKNPKILTSGLSLEI